MPNPKKNPDTPRVVLVVIQKFPGHERGEEITDADEIASILAGEWASHVVKRAA